MSSNTLPTARVLLLRLAATWLVIPCLVALSIAVVEYFWIVPVVLPLIFAWGFLALLSAVWAVQFIRRGAWRYGLLCLLLPAVILLAGVASLAGFGC